jgi:hypothetical protein
LNAKGFFQKLQTRMIGSEPERKTMPPTRYRGPPMTLRNMRENGVRSISITCHLCHHAAVLNVDRFAETVVVPSFGPRMVCTGCGIVGADALPNWTERSQRESLTGLQWR